MSCCLSTMFLHMQSSVKGLELLSETYDLLLIHSPNLWLYLFGKLLAQPSGSAVSHEVLGLVPAGNVDSFTYSSSLFVSWSI